MSRAPGFAIVALLAALAPAARADTLYKCVDSFGLTTIQHTPCPKDQKLVWARETAPEPPPTAEQLAAEQLRREKAAREAREQAAIDAIAAQRDAEAEQMGEELAAEERDKARRAAKRAGMAIEDEEQAPEVEEDDPDKRCADAKAFAQSLRAKPWINLEESQWRRVYGWVVQQCR